jgi:RES domain-containing protein
MVVWRISAARHAAAAFSGEGARKYAARWHRKGTALVYTSASLALATLEMFVNLKPLQMQAPLVAISAEIPTALKVSGIEEQEVPAHWRAHASSSALQDIGTGWVKRRESAVLAVPSAVLAVSPALIPMERNYLLNPHHPDFARIVIHTPAPFEFDPRMWKNW